MEKQERGLGKMERGTSYGYRLNLRQRGRRNLAIMFNIIY